MRKHDSKQAYTAPTARPTRVAKPVTVANHVEFGLSMLDPKERDQVQKAFGSWKRLWMLSKTAKPIGPTGDLCIADVSPHLYLVFRVSPDKAEVIDVINKRAFEFMSNVASPRPSE